MEPLLLALISVDWSILIYLISWWTAWIQQTRGAVSWTHAVVLIQICDNHHWVKAAWKLIAQQSLVVVLPTDYFSSNAWLYLGFTDKDVKGFSLSLSQSWLSLRVSPRCWLGFPPCRTSIRYGSCAQSVRAWQRWSTSVLRMCHCCAALYVCQSLHS